MKGEQHTIEAESATVNDTVCLWEDDVLYVGGPNDVALVKVLGDRHVLVKVMGRDEYDELVKDERARWQSTRDQLRAAGRIAVKEYGT